MIFIEFLIEVLFLIFVEFLFEKILRPIFQYIGMVYLKGLNIFLNTKIDIEKSPNKVFIGFLITLFVIFVFIWYLVYS